MDILPGLRAMQNYHPVFVHFPIAFWLGALLMEALAQARGNTDWHRTGVRLLYLGTIAAVFAVTTGLLAEDAVPVMGPAQEILIWHERLMMVSSSLALGLCMVAGFNRDAFTPRLRKFYLTGLMVLAVLLTLGADRGAQLVYQYGTAVHWPDALQQK